MKEGFLSFVIGMLLLIILLKVYAECYNLLFYIDYVKLTLIHHIGSLVFIIVGLILFAIKDNKENGK
jgi:hypothetical protein